MNSPITPIYTFVADDGENIHIDTDALRTWCLHTKPEIFDIPLKYDVATSFLHDNVIALDRIHELFQRPPSSLDPIIMAEDGTTHPENGGPNVLLVDGHHRFFLACLRGWAYIPGHVLKVPEWTPFRLHNLPSITRDQLCASPILKRNY
jgi:hypothetical protein